jgi:hypothetical protein
VCQFSYNCGLTAVILRHYYVRRLDIWPRVGNAATDLPREPRSRGPVRLARPHRQKPSLAGPQVALAVCAIALQRVLSCSGVRLALRPYARRAAICLSCRIPAQPLWLAHPGDPRRAAQVRLNARKVFPTTCDARSAQISTVIQTATSKRGAGRSAGNASSTLLACRKPIEVDLNGEAPRVLPGAKTAHHHVQAGDSGPR